MGRKGKTPEEKGHEHYSISHRRRRTRFITGDDDVPVNVRDYTGPAQFALIVSGEGCPLPVTLRDGGGCRGSCGRSAGTRGRRMASSCPRHYRGCSLQGGFLWKDVSSLDSGRLEEEDEVRKKGSECLSFR